MTDVYCKKIISVDGEEIKHFVVGFIEDDSNSLVSSTPKHRVVSWSSRSYWFWTGTTKMGLSHFAIFYSDRALYNKLLVYKLGTVITG